MQQRCLCSVGSGDGVMRSVSGNYCPVCESVCTFSSVIHNQRHFGNCALWTSAPWRGVWVAMCVLLCDCSRDHKGSWGAWGGARPISG